MRRPDTQAASGLGAELLTLERGCDFEYAPQDEVKISKRAGIVKESLIKW
jgi:hypothetical protein